MGTRDGAKETLAEIIEPLMKPLGFASKDNFSRIESLKGIKLLVNKLVDDAKMGAGPGLLIKPSTHGGLQGF